MRRATAPSLAPPCGRGACASRGGGAAFDAGFSPAACSRLEKSCAGRVATTGRACTAFGGARPWPSLATRLAAVGLTPSCPWNGRRWRASAAVRCTCSMCPCPKWSRRSAITALWTRSFRKTVTFRTFTNTFFWMTTLFTMCGPPQPPHQHVPTKPTGPHHGTMGSPKPSATQPTNGKGAPTLTLTCGPTNATRAGAYTGATTTGPGAQPQ